MIKNDSLPLENVIIHIKGYLCRKLFYHKVSVDAQLMIFFYLKQK